MKELIKELEKMDKLSFLLIKIFSLTGVVAVMLGFFATAIMKNTELGRHFSLMAAGLMAEGMWGAVLLDCIKRRAGISW